MRQGSFTKAAIELRVTQAAVSHQVARLEDLLGATLFLRTSQGLVPTDEGRLLFPVLEHGFDAMARVLDRLGGRRDIEVLKIFRMCLLFQGWRRLYITVRDFAEGRSSCIATDEPETSVGH